MARTCQGKLPDWDDLFAGYSAAVDWPRCSFRGELLYRYPDAKVILTVRDPERWYKSVASTIFPVLMRPMEMDDPAMAVQRKMALKRIFDQTFNGRFEDRELTIGVYEDHHEEVRPTACLCMRLPRAGSRCVVFLIAPLLTKRFLV